MYRTEQIGPFVAVADGRKMINNHDIAALANAIARDVSLEMLGIILNKNL
jgi:hypothetical protein